MAAFEFLQSQPGVAYLFPGQGSQTVGMLRDVVEQYPVAADTFAEADDILQFDLSRLCWDGPDDLLTDTVNAQPALLTASIALLRTVAHIVAHKVVDVTSGGPDTQTGVYVAGHSLGEFSALVAADVLPFGDALRLVRERGRLMKAAGEAQPGRMAAIIGLEEDKIAEICAVVSAQGSIVQVANDNCPGQVVISGSNEGMEVAVGALEKAGARRIIPLAVSIASHSPLMQPAADALRTIIAEIAFQTPSIPVIGNTTAKILTDVNAIRQELSDQLTGSVRWTSSMQQALTGGATRFVEVGPGEVLTGMIRRIDRGVERLAVHDVATMHTLVEQIQAA